MMYLLVILLLQMPLFRIKGQSLMYIPRRGGANVENIEHKVCFGLL